MKDTGSAPESPATDATVTAFERRFGHPPGLFVLFFTGMWERFAYYGVRGLLKLYMVNYLFVTLRQTLQGGSYAELGDPGAVVGWRFIHDLLPAADPEVLHGDPRERHLHAKPLCSGRRPLLLTVNPLCILLFAPLLDLVWRRQAKKGTAPSSLAKVAVSWRLVTTAFVVMVVAAKLTGAGGISAFWPIFSTMLLTLGELMFVPIGLSLLTKIAPVRGVSTMMAVWMLFTLFGTVVSGYLGVACAQWTSEDIFVMLTALGIGGSAVMWACKKPLSGVIGDEG